MKKKILIIGGDSLLGNYLYERLNKTNTVIKTSKIPTTQFILI